MSGNVDFQSTLLASPPDTTVVATELDETGAHIQKMKLTNTELATSAKQSDGTQKTQIVDANGNVILTNLGHGLTEISLETLSTLKTLLVEARLISELLNTGLNVKENLDDMRNDIEQDLNN